MRLALILPLLFVLFQPASPGAALVRLNVVVTDARGIPVSGLKPDDFEILEGGSPQPIVGVQARSVPAAAAARATQPERVIGLFLDEFHVAPGDETDRVRTAVTNFVNTQVREGDAVILLKPLDAVTGFPRLRDKDAMLAAVANFTGRKGDYTPRSAFESQYMSTAPPAAERQRARVVTTAIQNMVTDLREPDGAAKALLVVSGGFGQDDGTRDRITPSRAIVSAADRGDVTIYGFDPAVRDRDAVDKDPSLATLRLLAQQTGGELFTGATDANASLARVSRELDTHYVVSYQPKRDDDGRFHDVQVSVKRRNVQVRAATGYWAPFSSALLRAASASPFAGGTIRMLMTPHASGLIKPWFRMTLAPGGQTRLTMFWTPPDAAAAGTKAPAALVVTASTPQGKTLVERRRVTNSLEFDTPPGWVQVQIAIEDANGHLLDTDVRGIDVPNLALPIALGKPEIVPTRTVREFEARQRDADAAPASVLEFYRSERLIVRVSAYSASDKPTVSARLLNGIGKPMRDLTPLPSIGDAAQFDLPLSAFPRGDFRIELTATGAAGKTAQVIVFRVIG